MYLCDNQVIARETNFVYQGLTSILTPKNNQIADSTFSKYDLTGGDVSAPFKGFALDGAAWNFSAPVITSAIPVGSSYTRALKTRCTTGTSTSYIRLAFNKVKINPGDIVHAGFHLYLDGAVIRNHELYFKFYDIEGNLLLRTENYTYRTGAVGKQWSTIESARYIAPAGTHEVSLGYYTSDYALDETVYIADMFFGIK